MKRNLSIQIKAAFLLVVFSLNMAVGFACAIGIDMGFNSKHHHDDEATEMAHVHTDGIKHIHHEEADQDNHKSTDDQDNCCHDKVIKIAQLDKAIPPSLNIIQPIFFTAFISSFYNIGVSFLPQGSPGIKYFVRSHHPPISDIRIAIQSFQI
ncbi:hypothetical protein BH11BAC6_BH11BAC6_16370 [soil metagenome]